MENKLTLEPDDKFPEFCKLTLNNIVLDVFSKKKQAYNLAMKLMDALSSTSSIQFLDNVEDQNDE